MSSRRHFWLLEVTVGGQTYRWSTEDLEVNTANGETLDYSAGLGPVEMGAGDPEVDIEITDATVEWLSVGPLIDGARCVLRRWREGTALERAVTYAVGVATEPEWETRYDPIEWTIHSIEAVAPPMPDPTARVTESSTEFVEGDYDPVLADLGRYYPIVFGFPGYMPWYHTIVPQSDIIAVVPCPMRYRRPGAVQRPLSQVVISDDASRCLPDSVFLLCGDNDVHDFTATVFAETDELGRRITVADFSNDLRVLPDHDAEPDMRIRFSPDDGGVAAPRSAYDVIEYALQRWGGSTVDWPRIPEIRHALIGIQVDTWVTEEIEGGVWTWLAEGLGCAAPGSSRAPGLPLAIRTSANGRYLVPLTYTVDETRTIRTIDTSRGEAARVSGVRVSGTPVNELRIDYGDLDGDGAAFTIMGAEQPGNDPYAFSFQGRVQHAQAILSQARYGLRSQRLFLPWTWDLATAHRIATIVMDRDALPWRLVKYRVPEEWGLQEGDQVALVDEDVGLDEPAIVEGPPYISDAGMTVTLRMPGRA